jgi:hypothetical protein
MYVTTLPVVAQPFIRVIMSAVQVGWAVCQAAATRQRRAGLTRVRRVLASKPPSAWAGKRLPGSKPSASCHSGETPLAAAASVLETSRAQHGSENGRSSILRAEMEQLVDKALANKCGAAGQQVLGESQAQRAKSLVTEDRDSLGAVEAQAAADVLRPGTPQAQHIGKTHQADSKDASRHSCAAIDSGANESGLKTSRPPTGATSTSRGKPGWALTEAEAELRTSADEAALLSFADDLDFDAFVGGLNDQELAGAMQVWCCPCLL